MHLTSLQKQAVKEFPSPPTTSSSENGSSQSGLVHDHALVKPTLSSEKIEELYGQEYGVSVPSISFLDSSTPTPDTVVESSTLPPETGVHHFDHRPPRPVSPGDTNGELNSLASTNNNADASLPSSPSSPSSSIQYRNTGAMSFYDNSGLNHVVQSPTDFANNSDDLIAHESAPFITSRRYSPTPSEPSLTLDTSQKDLDLVSTDQLREDVSNTSADQPHQDGSLESTTPPHNYSLPHDRPDIYAKALSSPSTTIDSRRSNLASPTSPLSPRRHPSSPSRTILSSIRSKRERPSDHGFSYSMDFAVDPKATYSSRRYGHSSVIGNVISESTGSYDSEPTSDDLGRDRDPELDNDRPLHNSAREELRDRYLTSLVEYRGQATRNGDEDYKDSRRAETWQSPQKVNEDDRKIQSQTTSSRRWRHHNPEFWDNKAAYIGHEGDVKYREPEFLESSGSTIGKADSVSRRRYRNQLYAEPEIDSSPTVRSVTPSSSHDYNHSSSSYVSRRYTTRHQRNEPPLPQVQTGLTAPGQDRRFGPDSSPLLSASSSGSLRVRANAHSPAFLSSRPSSSYRDDIREGHYGQVEADSCNETNLTSERLSKRRSRAESESEQLSHRQVLTEQLQRKTSLDYSRDDAGCQIENDVEDIRKRIGALEPSRSMSRASVEEPRYGTGYNNSTRDIRKFPKAKHGHRLSLQQFNFSTPENRDRTYQDTHFLQAKEHSSGGNGGNQGRMKADRPWTSMERRTGLNHRFSRAQSVPVDSDGPPRSHSRQTDIWSITEEDKSSTTFKAQHILLETLEQFQSHFMRQIEQQNNFEAQSNGDSKATEAEFELDHFINKISNLVGITTRLNSGMRNFVNIANNLQGTSEKDIEQVEKSLKPLVKASEDQCRTLTESLLAFIRVDRGYNRHPHGNYILSPNPSVVDDKDRFIRAQTASPRLSSINKRASLDAKYGSTLASLERRNGGFGLGLSPTTNGGDDGSRMTRLRPSPLSEGASRYSDRSWNRRSADYFGRAYTDEPTEIEAIPNSQYRVQRFSKYSAPSRDPTFTRRHAPDAGTILERDDGLKRRRRSLVGEESLYQERRESTEQNESPGKGSMKGHRRKSTLSLKNSSEGVVGGVYIPRSGTAMPQQTSERVEKDSKGKELINESKSSAAEAQLRAGLRRQSSIGTTSSLGFHNTTYRDAPSNLNAR